MGQDPGIQLEDFTFIATDGVRVPAVRAKPAGRVQAGRVVVFNEIFGLSPWIRGVVQRLAKEGFRAVSFELFARQGPARGADMPALKERAAQLDVAQGLRDARSALDQLQPGLDGAIGFCMGGTLALHYAAQNPSTRACVSCYGRPRPDTVDLVGRIGCPVLGIYGDQDPSIPLEDAERLRAHFPPGSEMALYEAGHAFLNDTRKDFYVDEAATLAWAKIQGYLTRHLG